MAELIGGSGYDDVQDTAPSNPSVGDTWFDTSADPNGAGKIYADLGGGARWHVLPVQDELQSGRTRELLLLLQDKPVPEVQDPLNFQSNLSTLKKGNKSDNDFTLDGGEFIDDFEDNDTNVKSDKWSGWSGDTGQLSVQNGTVISGNYTAVISGGSNYTVIAERGTAEQVSEIAVILRTTEDSYDSNDKQGIVLESSNGYEIGRVEMVHDVSSVYVNGSDAGEFWSWETNHVFEIVIDWNNKEFDVLADGNYGYETVGRGFSFQNSSANDVKTVKISNDMSSSNKAIPLYFDDVREGPQTRTSGYATDQFAAPTTAPADFKAWNAIRAEDVTAGGSTSGNPVEFEILDSTDTVLTSSRIPKSEIADEPFKLREREYQTSAGSDGQSDYQIPETGDGGHYGIPILSVVTVSVAGNVLDPSNWSFDPTTSTVSIDTNNVTVSAGDTVAISYDFDVFDSTLKPRAYLSREDTSEDSPSISHFRYEYVI